VRSSTSWVKGKSGNPGGRPKALEEVLARSQTAEVFDELARLMRTIARRSYATPRGGKWTAR
jgi:Family of unknown function (DUF5681)